MIDGDTEKAAGISPIRSLNEAKRNRQTTMTPASQHLPVSPGLPEPFGGIGGLRSMIRRRKQERIPALIFI